MNVIARLEFELTYLESQSSTLDMKPGQQCNKINLYTAVRFQVFQTNTNN